MVVNIILGPLQLGYHVNHFIYMSHVIFIVHNIMGYNLKNTRDGKSMQKNIKVAKFEVSGIKEQDFMMV